MKGITNVAKKLGISSIDGKGYRALANISDYGGQEVPHLHFHLFGGEKVGKNGFVITKVDRKYLEINSPDEINLSKNQKVIVKIEKKNPPDFQINKFFYKQIGKSYRWIDRLVWNDTKWMDYTNNSNLETYILERK